MIIKSGVHLPGCYVRCIVRRAAKGSQYISMSMVIVVIIMVEEVTVGIDGRSVARVSKYVVIHRINGTTGMVEWKCTYTVIVKADRVMIKIKIIDVV